MTDPKDPRAGARRQRWPGDPEPDPVIVALDAIARASVQAVKDMADQSRPAVEGDPQTPAKEQP